jgi:hypothetical protein
MIYLSQELNKELVRMAMTKEELKIWVENNQHAKNFPKQVILSAYLNARDCIFHCEYDMKTIDKRTKEYVEKQKEIALNKEYMPQLAEAYEKLTGTKIPY